MEVLRGGMKPIIMDHYQIMHWRRKLASRAVLTPLAVQIRLALTPTVQLQQTERLSYNHVEPLSELVRE